jgi:hypothetical protein
MAPAALQRLDGGEPPVAGRPPEGEGLWVTSSRHAVHREEPVPLALGRPACNWRLAAIEAVLRAEHPHAGAQRALRQDRDGEPRQHRGADRGGVPPLPACRIGLMRHRAGEPNPLADILAGHIRQSLDNLALDGRIRPIRQAGRGAKPSCGPSTRMPERSALSGRTETTSGNRWTTSLSTASPPTHRGWRRSERRAPYWSAARRRRSGHSGTSDPDRRRSSTRSWPG